MESIIGIFSESFWYVAPVLVTVTTFLTGLINQGLSKLCTLPGFVKQLFSWIVGTCLSVAAWGLKVITFGDPVWLGVIALAVVVGLASNGIYDIDAIKKWINSWFTAKIIVSNTTEEKEVED